MKSLSWLKSLRRRLTGRDRRSVCLATRLQFELLEDRTVPAQFLVTSNLDDGSAGTLRWAIDQANAIAGADEIVFDAANLFATPQTITLSQVGNPVSLYSDASGPFTLTGGELHITDSLNIVGSGAGQLTVSGNQTRGVFAISAGTAVSFSGLTIADGNQGPLFGGGILNLDGPVAVDSCVFRGNYAGAGGAVINWGTMTIRNTTFTGNRADYDGGAILNGWPASMTVTDCTFSGNAARGGGGIYNTGILKVTDCTFTANSAGDDGGGIHSNYTLEITGSAFTENQAGNMGGGISLNMGTISNSTLSHNHAVWGGGGISLSQYGSSTVVIIGTTVFENTSAADGGGIHVHPEAYYYNLIVRDCAIWGNTAVGIGGGISFAGGTGSFSVANCTIAHNTAGDSGGGIFAWWNGSLDFQVVNSTFAYNAAGRYGAAIEGAFPGQAENSIFTMNSPADEWRWGFETGIDAYHNFVGADVLLAPRGDYGGPTPTMPLLPGSPATGAGGVDLAGYIDPRTFEFVPLTTDQRGLPRVVNGLIDIGAYQTQRDHPSIRRGRRGGGDAAIPRRNDAHHRDGRCTAAAGPAGRHRAAQDRQPAGRHVRLHG